MAEDRKALGLLGAIFCGVTVAVTMMAAIVVVQHVEGYLVLDGTTTATTTVAASQGDVDLKNGASRKIY